MLSRVTCLLFASLATATITVTDPGDIINPALWTSDNALLADTSVRPTGYQFIDVVGPYFYNTTKTTSIDHQFLTVDGNDTSVIVVTDGSQVNMDYVEILKYGYASNIIQSSYYGINAAVNVANGSIARFSHLNITTHNGAANLYSYGTGTVAYVDNAWLYSSGPVAHGLYAGGNGTVYGSNIQPYSGGYRCSIFSGDSPAGYINIKDAVVHTDGIGSAVCYALGVCNMTNVIGHASQSPVMFADGVQHGYWTDCDLTAGLLAGMAMFSSSVKTTGGTVMLKNTKLTVHGKTVPGFWFGNVGFFASIINSVINTASGILAVANYSQVTQGFNTYAGYVDNPRLLPANGELFVEESALTGDLIAYNGSTLSISLAQYSSWTGKMYAGSSHNPVQFGVALDTTSIWTLTGNVSLQNLTSASPKLSNIVSKGFNIKYNSSAPANKALGGKTFMLKGGGKAMPM